MPIPASMSAIASYAGLSISDGMSLFDVTMDTPRPEPRDVIVRVEAVSVNPADTKRRADLPRSATPVVLGYDAAGTVVAVGSQVTTLSVGDAVYYAGVITRPGSNADSQAVDERIVGRKPASLYFAEAAAIPLNDHRLGDPLRPLPSHLDQHGVAGDLGGCWRCRLSDDPARQAPHRAVGVRVSVAARVSRLGP